MTRLFLFLCCFFFSALHASNLPSNETTATVTWLKWDDPPIFILSGKFKAQGTLDIVERDLIANLPTFNHQSLEANVRRVIQLAKEKTETCNAGWLNTKEWRDIFYLSTPIFKLPTNGILVKSCNREKISGSGNASLVKILREKKLRMATGRLYGEGIDPLLHKVNYQRNKQIDVVANSFLAHQMLQRDRVDFTIGYPSEVNYYRAIMADSAPLSYIPLDENGDYVDVVVACSKTALGKKVIDRVNLLLKSEKRRMYYQQSLNRWLTAEEVKKMNASTSD